MGKKQVVIYGLLLISALAYAALGYATPRQQFVQLFILYAIVFAGYVYLINQRFSIWQGIGAAITFRLILLFAVPALSDDYFRFIWDGRLLMAGENPYLHLPSFYFSAEAAPVPGITQALFRQLNSPDYYSVYPPVAQGVFWLAEKLAGGNILASIVTMRVVLLLADAGNILLLLKLLRKMGLSDKSVLLYALNPLVILELTGNLHFEALMLFFVLLALYLLHYRRYLWAGAALGLAIATKLLPFLFLPFILRRLGYKRFIGFAAILGLVLVLVFLPLVTPAVISHFFQSINLYFQRFEFNASIYYLLRWVGFRISGYNQIAVIGPLLSLATLVIVLSMAAVKKLGSLRRLAGYMAAALTIYLFLATTVHPWYITTLIALTAMSNFRYAVVWSGLAFLSYANYRTNNYHEDLALVALEYTIVFLWVLVELYLYRQRQKQPNLAE
ncbi:glycosyltransferase 87 family protein [Pontibacter vulgaris]|uniref:glycosyltransferase 87 family protein n=1 Tax=Pontibacter vulgaris TaxID=2905679 RepID=UPI001FA6AF3F|nr:glycosyltransferase 87 family protein [Pontibacter vulgaris]